jgi:hypothetical protein
MNWAIRRLAGSSTEWVSIDQAEYNSASTALNNVLHVLELEEKWDVLIGNYEELEVELLRLTTEKAIHRKSDWHDGARNRRLLNRRVNNLLSSCRLYLDHLRHSFTNVFGPDSAQLSTIDDARHREYDASFSYRLLEELRNYTQHRRLPIDIELTTFKPTSYGEDSQVACALTPMLTTANVLEDDKVKARFRPELEKQVDRIDLKVHCRGYVHGLYNIHLDVRCLVEPRIKEADGIITDLMNRYTVIHSHSLLGLHIVAQSDESPYPVVTEKNPLFKEPLLELRAMQERNDLRPDFARHYITGQDTTKIIQQQSNNRVERTGDPRPGHRAAHP